MSGLRDEYGELAAFMNLDGDLCDFCQRRCDDVEPVTITDTSGGGSARLCASCRTFATATRCGLCGDVKGCDGKADSIHFGLGDTGSDRDPAPICDDCREDVLRNRGERT
jgi:hypothetical protein